MRLGMTDLLLMVKYVYMTPWCPANRLKLYRVMILSVQVSDTARTAVSFSGVILKNRESNRMDLSTNIFTFLIVILEVGNVFCDKYRKMSLKWELVKYLAWISFISTSKCVPLSTILCFTLSILSISACFGKTFWIRLPLLIRSFNSFGSWNNDLSGLWIVSEITPLKWRIFLKV